MVTRVYARGPEREGLLDTPDRVAALVWKHGMQATQPPAQQFHEEGNKEMVIVRDILSHLLANIIFFRHLWAICLLHPANYTLSFKIARR